MNPSSFSLVLNERNLSRWYSRNCRPPPLLTLRRFVLPSYDRCVVRIDLHVWKDHHRENTVWKSSTFPAAENKKRKQSYMSFFKFYTAGVHFPCKYYQFPLICISCFDELYILSFVSAIWQNSTCEALINAVVWILKFFKLSPRKLHTYINMRPQAKGQ